MAYKAEYSCVVLSNIGSLLFETKPQSKKKNSIVKKYLKNRFPEFDIVTKESFCFSISNKFSSQPSFMTISNIKINQKKPTK